MRVGRIGLVIALALVVGCARLPAAPPAPPAPPVDAAPPIVVDEQQAAEAQTELAAGTSSYQGGYLANARSHLAAAGPEGRYPLALVLESLGDLEAARKLLQELPDSEAVRQGLARLDSRLPGFPLPPSSTGRWILSDTVLSVVADGQTLQATGPDGKVAWQLECGEGPVTDLVFAAGARRAILFTARQGCLFDPATGARLGTTPGSPYYASIEGFAWRGDLVAFGEDIAPPDPRSAAYFGTNWKVYRLSPDGGVQFLYEAEDGSRMAALSADGRTLFSWFGNHGAGRPRRFRDGQLVTTYDKLLPVGAEFALDPRGDRFYLANYLGTLQAYSLEGERLWEQPAQDLPLALWPGDDGRLLLVVRDTENSTAVYDDQGARIWGAPGWPGNFNSRFLLVRQPYEHLLYDRTGRVVARYPLNTYFTADGRALYLPTEGGVALYRLPQ